MPLPDFTNDEQYVINFIKSPKIAGASGAFMWGYVVGGILLGGFGAYLGSVPMMTVAFIVVCGFRVYEEWYQSRWTPVWRSVIEKYESAVIGNNGRSADDLDGET